MTTKTMSVDSALLSMETIDEEEDSNDFSEKKLLAMICLPEYMRTTKITNFSNMNTNKYLPKYFGAIYSVCIIPYLRYNLESPMHRPCVFPSMIVYFVFIPVMSHKGIARSKELKNKCFPFFKNTFPLSIEDTHDLSGCIAIGAFVIDSSYEALQLFSKFIWLLLQAPVKYTTTMVGCYPFNESFRIERNLEQTFLKLFRANLISPKTPVWAESCEISTIITHLPNLKRWTRDMQIEIKPSDCLLSVLITSKMFSLLNFLANSPDILTSIIESKPR